MELKDFIQQALIDIDGAVDEARKIANREIAFSATAERRTVEFDIAVTVEEHSSTTGKAALKVLAFAEAGGSGSVEQKNSTVSRISFGIVIDSRTKLEVENGTDLSMTTTPKEKTFVGII